MLAMGRAGFNKGPGRRDRALMRPRLTQQLPSAWTLPRSMRRDVKAALAGGQQLAFESSASRWNGRTGTVATAGIGAGESATCGCGARMCPICCSICP